MREPETLSVGHALPRPCRALSLSAGLLLAACGGEGATLALTVPSPSGVAPRCAGYVAVRLRVDGSLRPCGSVQVTTGDRVAAVRIVCDESVGLLPETPYEVAVGYYQGATLVAEGRLDAEATRLAPGLNARTLAPEQVRTDLDANGNGSSDLNDACP